MIKKIVMYQDQDGDMVVLDEENGTIRSYEAWCFLYEVEKIVKEKFKLGDYE